jgi:hypothetical protein
MNSRVLIGFADALAGIESAWSLTDHGFEVHTFARRGLRPAMARSRKVRVVEVTAPEDDALACAAEIADIAAKLAPAAVLPLDDHAVWLCDQAFGESRPGMVAGPTGRLATLALDKREQFKIAAAAGFAVPPYTLINTDHTGPTPTDDSGPEASSVWSNARHNPVTTVAPRRAPASFAGSPGREGPEGAFRPGDVNGEQPQDGGGSGGLRPPENIVKPALAVELHAGKLRRGSGRVASTAEQVRVAADAIGGPVIVQQRVTGVGEGVFGLAVNGRAVVLTAHRRIRMMNPRGSGSSACRSTPVPDDVAGPVQQMIAAAGWHGLFMIELLREDEGRPWFMELNGRTWGSMALATRRGYSYPSWAVRAARDPAFVPDEPEQVPHITARHLGRELVHLGFVLVRGDAPRLVTARDVLMWRRGDRWYNYRRGEQGVFFADTWATLRAQVAHRLPRRAR